MSVKKAAQLLRESQYGVVLTGAGISTPSGIPDFRSSKNGLWEKFNPMEVASLSVFRVRPENFFNWFRPMAKTIFEALPNPAHKALAKLGDLGHIKEIITQNIDGLHQKAGSKIVHEIHGTMNTLTCVNCRKKYDSKEFIWSFINEGSIPHCKDCSAILKPDVILMEEQLPIRVWRASEKAIKKCDLLLVAGSSLEVVPVAGLPYQAVSRNAELIIVNNEPTYIDSRAAVVLNYDVAEALPAIADELT